MVRMVILQRVRVLRWSLLTPSCCRCCRRCVDRRRAPGPLLLPAAERLQARLEGPPVLVTEVLLQLSGEGYLELVAHAEPFCVMTEGAGGGG